MLIKAYDLSHEADAMLKELETAEDKFEVAYKYLSSAYFGFYEGTSEEEEALWDNTLMDGLEGEDWVSDIKE